MGNWKSRVNKTLQDRLHQDSRPRKQDWDRRIAWMQKHKPMCSRDWLKYR